jgi:hypothetical protein
LHPLSNPPNFLHSISSLLPLNHTSIRFFNGRGISGKSRLIFHPLGLVCKSTDFKNSPFGMAKIFNYAFQPFKAYCAIWVRRSNFHYQVSPHESTQQRKVELLARNVREFCLSCDSHVTFRGLLHAIKLRHGTDGFTSPPKQGVLRIFSPLKFDGFGRVRTLELGYQRSARYHRSRYGLGVTCHAIC